jgi:tRNA (guanine-N7-)-methyltransferase
MPDEPRFRDLPADKRRHPDLNPYLEMHRTFGPPVLTARQAQGMAGKWETTFGRKASLHLEIGTGNGFFLTEMARRHPEWNWLGMELRFKRVILTARKLKAAGVDGEARVMRYDAHCMDDLFSDNDLDGVYINHPDPWPKDRQAKHRLFSDRFCSLLDRLVSPGSEVRLKTDFVGHIEMLRAHAEAGPWEILGHSQDIARDGAPWENDFTTNYQGKFNEIGAPVFALQLRRGE